MNRDRYGQFILWCVLLAIIASCNREAVCPTRKRTTGLPLETTLMDAFAYKPGSYWIYQDSLSGNQDTLWATDAKNTYQPVQPWDCQYLHTVSYHLKGLEPYLSEPACSPCNDSIYIQRSSQAYVYFFNQVRLYADKQTYWNADTQSILDIYPVHIRDTTYAALKISLQGRNATSLILYYTPSIGIVRYDVYTGGGSSLIQKKYLYDYQIL